MYSNFKQACHHAHTIALKMSSMYDYFKREETSCLPAKPPPGSTLTQAEIKQTNELVKKSVAKEGACTPFLVGVATKRAKSSNLISPKCNF